MSPLVLISKSFGKYVSAHVFGLLVAKLEHLGFVAFMKPSQVDSMGPVEVSHGRVTACEAHLDHGRVVIMEYTFDLVCSH